jgi:phospholipase/lecithinase/hemolysin
MKTKIVLAAGFSLISWLLPFKASAATFSKMYVFGDSTSDTGNEFNVNTFAKQFLDPTTPILPPSPLYFNGRYSNGPVWVEYLAEDLGFALTPSTELVVGNPITIAESGFRTNLSYGGATVTQSVNFAFWGAETGFGNTNPRLPGVLEQMQGFIDDLRVTNSSADPNALYIVLAGANNYVTGRFIEAEEPVDNIATAVSSLYNVGARNFLVPNLPDFGKFPVARSLGSEVAVDLTTVVKEHNSLLGTTFERLNQSLPEINLIPLDLYSFINDRIANPTKYGYTNVTAPCLVGEFPNFSVCDRPEEYLFWDSVHGTTVFYASMGEFASEAVTSKAKSIAEPTPLVFYSLLGLVGVLLKFLKLRLFYRRNSSEIEDLRD